MLSLDTGTDAEDEIRRLIVDHERSVADLQTEINSLMQGIRSIHLQIAKHEKEIWFLKGKITLARRLPPEILASIFEACILDRWTRAPLVVSQVCSEWRRAAQAPSIWSQIYINVDSLDPYKRTRLWLIKSQSVPIDITIDLRNYTGHVSETMSLLSSHRSRWRSFTLISLHLSPANDVLRRCTGIYPILRTLCVSIAEEFGTIGGVVEEDAGLSLGTAFNDSPYLRSYMINRNVLVGSDIPPNITNLSISLDGVITVSLSITTVLHIIAGLSTLEEFSVSLTRAQDTSFLPNRDAQHLTTLPTLKALTLIGQPDLFALLQNIHTPSLQYLRLMSSSEPIPVSHQWSGLMLLQWLALGNTSLELLELRDVDVAQDVFISCLKSLTKLRTLKLHDSEISDAVFESLHGDQGYCPHLSKVDLRWCSVVTGHALVNFVRDRSQMSARPIESITVINCSFVEDQDILDLAQFTVCRLVIDSNDYCRTAGCCENRRYRNRLMLRGFSIGMEQKKRRRLIL
ncbi:hypothetical protein C8J55DRAFT_511692 [Lentinula edodes]|uniref:F-box domain-containing protein n=1 Tax=Lentinula lateritia TaxID=40482 RepID=A0A9W9AGB0_9AGAR|nr:hypothetical protein C8J55DRAFT_511692 [Lentinula edodes]